MKQDSHHDWNGSDYHSGNQDYRRDSYHRDSYRRDSYRRDFHLNTRFDDSPPPRKRPHRDPSYYDQGPPPLCMEPAPVEPPPANGEQDAKNPTEWHYLLVRNLKKSTTEVVFSKGLEKLNKTQHSNDGSTPGGLRRVLIIRDKISNKSMGFGFAEYHDVADAKAALRVAKELAEKLTISSNAIDVSFPNRAVFYPADLGKAKTKEKYVILSRRGGDDPHYYRHQYRDERYYATELIVNEQPPSTEAPKVEAVENSLVSAKRPQYMAEDPGFIDSEQNTGGPNKKRKTTSSLTSRIATPPWQQTRDMQSRLESEEAAQSQPASAVVGAISAPPQPVVSDQQTFIVDSSEKKCCFLCKCEFSEKGTPQRHLKGSSMHAQKLKDDNAKAEGYQRLKKAGFGVDATIKLLLSPVCSDPPPSAAERSYRDRAAERRQSEKISVPLEASKRAALSSTAPLTSSPEPADSFGKRNLKAQGWIEGEGLGKVPGVKAPIEAVFYAAGVGLGHEGGKKGNAAEEAARMTRDEPGEYQRKGLEMARQRLSEAND